MEFILSNTDIFDEEIDKKLKDIILNNMGSFDLEKAYKLTVSFHVNLLSDPRFQVFNVPVRSKTSKGTEKDNIYDVMSFQLKKIEEILKENNIESYSKTIQGDYLEAENIIKIEIYEDTSEPKYNGRGKNKTRMGVNSIMPSRPFIQEKVSDFASERISEIYYDLMNIVRDKKIMSEILEIEETKDDDKLFRAFAEQYGDLWLPTDGQKEKLFGRLKERIIAVVEKHSKKEDKEN